MRSVGLQPDSTLQQHCRRAYLKPSLESQYRGGFQPRKPGRLQVRANSKESYQALGLDQGADEKAIKRAYRRLALRHALLRRLHPDHSKEPGAAANFLKIQEAYEVLSGRRQGKDLDSRPANRGGWDFHDWYWQFSAGRKWASRKGQAAKAGPAPAATAQTQAQLDGLRRKAAFRQQQARQSQQAEAPHQAEASPAGADLGTPAPAAGAVQAEAADRESVHAPQARPSPQQPSTSSHHMAHGMPASCSSNPSAPGQNDAPVDTSQRHAATYVEMSWAAAHQSKASSDVVAAPAPHKSAMQQPAAAGSAALQSSGPGQPDQGFSSPDWVEGSLEARLRMLSLDLLHINLHLRAIAPGTELWRSQAVPGDTPVRSSDSQQNSSMVTEVGSQAEESTCGPPPRSADDLQIQPSINASREEGRGSNESDRPRQFLGSLNGLDNVQSQLAGLRRKVARRPADVE